MTPAHRTKDPQAQAAVDEASRKLDEVAALVESARSMPMSASCIVNRSDVLAMLDELRELLPVEFRQAQYVIRDRDEVVEEGRREAERIVAAAREERLRLIEETEVVQEALAERERILAEATERSEAMRQEVDDYVDTKLANFEVVLTRTLGAVERGREKLRSRGVADRLDGAAAAGSDDADAPLPGAG